MIRKEPADWVFFNVIFLENVHEAIAIRDGEIIDIGSIPHIFSNYRGFKDFNGQGHSISNVYRQSVEVGHSADGVIIFVLGDQPLSQRIIWEIKNKKCLERHTELLDPHWDDH